jgi:hypothetical protein
MNCPRDVARISPSEPPEFGEPSEVTPDRSTVTRLSDLRRAQPADATLRNLLGVLTAKLELFAHLPVFEYEAGVEGHDSTATAFRRLADQERGTFYELLACLRAHLDEIVSATDDPAPTNGVMSEGRA